MKLQRAVSMDHLAEGEDFGDREERQERRERRRERRQGRRKRRRSRKAEKHRAKAERLEQGGRRGRRRRRRNQEEPEEAALVRAPQRPSWRQTTMAPPLATPSEPEWPEDLPQDQGDYALQPPQDGYYDEEAMPFEEEVMGLAWPNFRLRQRWQASRAARAAAAAPAAAQPALPAVWSPQARMGQHMRIQARAGYRAAVVELKPGLYVVAEIPEQATRPEFGVVPLIAPMMMRAVNRVATRRQARLQQAQAQQGQGQPQAAQAQPQRQGLLAMFRHPQPGQPQVVQPVQVQPAQAQPVAQLPGPVAQPGQGQALMPMPQPVEWAAVQDFSGNVRLVPLVR